MSVTSILAKGAAYDAASCAIVGAMMGPEMGAVGGALFGAFRYGPKIISTVVAHKLHLLDASAQRNTKLATRVFIHFASSVPAWGALTYAGFSLPFSRIVDIAAADFIFGTVLPAVIESIGTSLRRANAN